MRASGADYYYFADYSDAIAVKRRIDAPCR